MATFDDRQWILSLIHNAYVTTDDTGLCEIIMQGNEGKKQVNDFPFLFEDDDALNFPTDMDLESPDITSDTDFASHRHRSHTERKSERLKKERERASRIKRISWKHRSREPISEADLSEMFQRKTSFGKSNDSTDAGSSTNHTSLLSHLLQTKQDLTSNSFLEYSKFDGTTHNNIAGKKINIFLYVGKNPCLDYPLQVNVVTSARVLDLIGLICWLYTKENRVPPVKTIDHYQLHIADEDGQVDWEFHPLEKRDIIEKYGFTTLAFVEKELPDSNPVILVTVNFARGEFSKLEVNNQDITLKEILNKSISRRKEIAKMQEVGVNYHLEKEHEPGVVLDLDKTITEVKCTEFAAVRDNSKRSNGHQNQSNNVLDVTSAQSFVVLWEKKFSKLETRIDISGEKIDICPLPPKGGTSILSVRTPVPINYKIDKLVDCDTRPFRKNKLELVTITIQGEHSFKNFKFICDLTTSQELFDKCRGLIKINNLKTRERKPLRPPIRRHNSLSVRKKSKSENVSLEV